VIAADAGGFRESVRPGRNGVLVRPDNPQAFAAAIAELVADPARRRAYAAAARATAVERDVRREDAELIEQYRTLAGLPQPGAVTCAA
jgi:glycosyltransferase involved in cell wall biosynthesis